MTTASMRVAAALIMAEDEVSNVKAFQTEPRTLRRKKNRLAIIIRSWACIVA